MIPAVGVPKDESTRVSTGMKPCNPSTNDPATGKAFAGSTAAQSAQTKIGNNPGSAGRAGD